MLEKLNDYDVTIETHESINQKLKSLKQNLSKKTSFLGVDGYVDSLYSICQTRENATSWTKMDSMSTFSELLMNVAGSSANVERILKRKISGGFAPNSCKAINGLGIKVNLIAAMGFPEIDDNFKSITDKENINAISFANPGETVGLEFNDGKIMLTDFENILNINWNLILERVGLETLIEKIEESEILGFGHWSLVPHLEEIWHSLLKEVFPLIKNLKNKWFFVDLADIKKRVKEDILGMLEILQKIDKKIPVILSLNDQEAIKISKTLDGVKMIDYSKKDFKDYVEAGKNINQEVNISHLVIHSPHFATITTKDNHYWVTQGFTSKPRYTTGAGDYFHSGTAVGLSCQLTPPEAILMGNALTSIFIRTGNSPDINELLQFIKNYMEYIEEDNPNFP